jgi:transcriptional regulator with XRE-family HTH domain
MNNLNKRIGSNLKELRQINNLNLDQLAKITGVSKSMISRIENSTSTPTVTTLWKICNGLKVSFSSIMNDMEKPNKIIKKNEMALDSIDPTNQLYSIIPYENELKFEIFEMEIFSKQIHVSEPHIGAIEEAIYIISGSIEIQINGESLYLENGDLYRFKPDTNHNYVNHHNSNSRLLITIIYR